MLGAMAQELSPTKQINAIKRDSAFVYAEATEATVAQAFDAAKVQLMLQIKEYIQSQLELQEADMVLVKDEAAKCERIEMLRGDKYRVFVYVKKSNILPAQTITCLPKSTWQAMEGAAKGNVYDEQAEDKFEAAETDSDEATLELQTDNSPLDSQSTTGESATAAASRQTNTVLKEWQQTLINTLQGNTDMEACLIFLEKMRIQHKVKRLGNRSELPRNPEQAFYAIFSADNTLKCILGKEENGCRMNYFTKQYETLANYSSDNYIWFTLSNF